MIAKLRFSSDLSSEGDIQNVILESFSSPNEDVKSAASYALGEFNGLSQGEKGAVRRVLSAVPKANFRRISARLERPNPKGPGSDSELLRWRSLTHCLEATKKQRQS